MHTFAVTEEELDMLIDALKKGASRHNAFANFSPQSKVAGKHDRAASIMNRLQLRLVRLKSA